MEPSENSGNSRKADVTVSYESPPVAELEVDGVDYRVDPGRNSAIAVSQREVGSYVWNFVVEGNWDGVRLKAKGLPHSVVSLLERALKSASADRES
jgi:hypothetical protein